MPIQEQKFLIDQRSQRKLLNNSIGLVSVLRETTTNSSNETSMHSDHPIALVDDLNEPSTSQNLCHREVKSLAPNISLEIPTGNFEFNMKQYLRFHSDDSTEAYSASSYNMVELNEVSKAADRYSISDRAAAAIATATLIDFGLISANDNQLIIDRNKIRRSREKIRTRQMQNLSFDGIQALYFDGRKDLTKVYQNNAIKTVKEEHISFIQEPNSFYIGHKTPESGTADSICHTIESILHEKGIPVTAIKAIGCDGTNVNTGEVGGVIRKLEVKWNRPLQWIICMLHMNELPLRAIITTIDGTTTGPRAFSGPIGSRLNYCELSEPVEFDPITFDYNTECLDQILDTLNTDQKYLFDICVAISNAEFSRKLAHRAPGAISHSRWLTTANRILRLYVSEKNPSQKLRTLATYIIKVYAPMVFEIKKNWSIVNGPLHLARIINLSKCLPQEYFNVVKVSLSRNAYLAHPENVMLALLNDDDMEVRQNGWLNVFNARNISNDQTLRIFKVPKLNFDCTDYKDLVTIDSTDPPLLRSIEVNAENIEFLSSKPLLDHDIGVELAKIPLHTQAVERCVKVVTEAAKSVCGEEKRNGWIANTLGSRNIMPKFNTKSDFRFSNTFKQNLKI